MNRLPIQQIYSLIAVMGLALVPMKAMSSAIDSALNANLAIERIEKIESLEKFDSKIYQDPKLELGSIESRKTVFCFTVIVC